MKPYKLKSPVVFANKQYDELHFREPKMRDLAGVAANDGWTVGAVIAVAASAMAVDPGVVRELAYDDGRAVLAFYSPFVGACLLAMTTGSAYSVSDFTYNLQSSGSSQSASSATGLTEQPTG